MKRKSIYDKQGPSGFDVACGLFALVLVVSLITGAALALI